MSKNIVNVLRGFQQKELTRILRGILSGSYNSIIVAHFVGAGKTIFTCILASEILRLTSIKKIIIVAPYRLITDSFIDTYKTKGIWKTAIGISLTYVISKITNASNETDLVDFITDKRNGILICTSGLFTRPVVREAILALEVGAKIAVISDEDHHSHHDIDADGNIINSTVRGEMMQHLFTNKIMCIRNTATPCYNSGGASHVIPNFDESLVSTRTYAEQYKDGLAPAIKFSYIHTDTFKLMTAKTTDPFNVIETRRTKFVYTKTGARRLVEEINNQLIKGKFPKLLIRIPAGDSSTYADVLKSELEKIQFPDYVVKKRNRNHPNVLIATGIGSDDKDIELENKQVSLLEADNHSNGRLYDIIIACRKFDEGANCPSIAMIIACGIPQYIKTIIQISGRGLRNKYDIKGYADWFDKSHMDETQVTFFIPEHFEVVDLQASAGKMIAHTLIATEEITLYCNHSSINLFDGIKQIYTDALEETDNKELTKSINSFIASIARAEQEYTLDCGKMILNAYSKFSDDPTTIASTLELLNTDDSNFLLNSIATLNKLSDNDKKKILTKISMSLDKKLKANPKKLKLLCERHESDIMKDIVAEYTDKNVTFEIKNHVKEAYALATGHDVQLLVDELRKRDNALKSLTNDEIKEFFECRYIPFCKTHNHNPRLKSDDINERNIANTYRHIIREAKRDPNIRFAK